MTSHANRDLSALFDPISINGMVVPNRIVMGPMAASAPSPQGIPSDQTIAFIEARARGGVGMIIVGGGVATTRAWAETPIPRVLRMDHDGVVKAYAGLIDTVHRHGTKIVYELSPSFGRMAQPGPGRPALISASPSNVVIAEDRFVRGLLVPGGITTPMAREATLEEIESIEDETAAAALRCRQAGFDGVELAAHMSYFLASFLTPRCNHRTDRYGGTLENRARILVNVITKMRARVGRDYPIGLRIPCSEHVPGGQETAAYAQIAAHAERAGIDYVAMVDGCYESMNVSAAAEDGTMLRYGEPPIFKQALSVPTLLSNAHDPALAARAIEGGQADMTMLARALLADPEYANKARAGAADTIVRCQRDNLCMKRMIMGFPVRCEVNPRMGREARPEGGWPPAERLLQAPLEQTMLTLSRSKTFMGLVGRAKRGAH